MTSHSDNTTPLNFCLCGNVLDVLPRLVAGGLTAQCVVTSPPYWGLRDYGHPDQLGQESIPEEYLTNMVTAFKMVFQILADDGVLWLNMGDTYGGKSLLGLPWRLALELREHGWLIRSECIWHKPQAMPESVKDRPTRAHEHIFMLTKSPNYYYDWEAVAEAAIGAPPRRLDKEFHAPGQKPHKGLRKTALKARSVRPGIDTKGGNQGHGLMSWDTERRNLRDVWTVGTETNAKHHFASFPMRVAEICVKSSTRPGDLVFDPFMGSGTVAVVAENLGRPWLGVELNPDYIDIQERRLAEINPLLKAVNL